MYLISRKIIINHCAVCHKRLTLSKDCRCAFVSLDAVFLESSDIVSIGIGRTSDHNIGVVVEDSRRYQFSADGLSI